MDLKMTIRVNTIYNFTKLEKIITQFTDLLGEWEKYPNEPLKRVTYIHWEVSKW